jgi:hypothetical protein
LTRARIIFVPGLNPKPPPELYRAHLLRVLCTALARSRPRAAELLEAHAEDFVLVAWTYLFHGAHRDITVDLPGIERLLLQTEPSAADVREMASWPRRWLRWSHLIGDTFPFIGRRLAAPTTRRLMHEANRYLKNRDGVGSTVRAALRATLEDAVRDAAPVLLIGHSLGSVIAYDTLWELTHVQHAPVRVELLLTIGSPLGTRFVQRSLHGARESGARRYPHNVRRWINLAARGDTTALKPRLEPVFRPMLDLDLVESIADFPDLRNYFRGELGLNVHEAYGYLVQPILAEIVGDFLLSSSPHSST